MDIKQITKLGAILFRYLDVSDWEEIFRLCGLENYLYDYPRFIASLKWGDDDAKGNCFNATEYLYSKNFEDFFANLRNKTQVMKIISEEIPDVYSEIMKEEAMSPIDVEEIASHNQILRKAIDDAEILMEKSDPASAYDRVYTALHGLLEQKCKEQSIKIGDKDTVTSILSKIRDHINSIKPPDKVIETVKILASIIKIIDLMNDIRNKKSLVHPNKTLLENDEALFLINISKAIMRYINDIMN